VEAFSSYEPSRNPTEQQEYDDDDEEEEKEERRGESIEPLWLGADGRDGDVDDVDPLDEGRVAAGSFVDGVEVAVDRRVAHTEHHVECDEERVERRSDRSADPIQSCLSVGFDPWVGLGWVEFFFSFWWVGLGSL